MDCPHCNRAIQPEFASAQLQSKYKGHLVAGNGRGEPASWVVESMACPACDRAIVVLNEHPQQPGKPNNSRIVQPQHIGRKPAPAEVPVDLAEDYNEASAVLGISAKASAALSRRCLQNLLRQNGYVQRDLVDAIAALINSRTLSSLLADSLNAIRHIGNFAAHPVKNKNTGEIVPVEPHEAEWNLELLDGLFEFFYVRPAKEAQKRDALNAKLIAAGKRPME